MLIGIGSVEEQGAIERGGGRPTAGPGWRRRPMKSRGVAPGPGERVKRSVLGRIEIDGQMRRERERQIWAPACRA